MKELAIEIRTLFIIVSGLLIYKLQSPMFFGYVVFCMCFFRLINWMQSNNKDKRKRLMTARGYLKAARVRGV